MNDRGRTFLDTNVLIYAFGTSPEMHRADLLLRHGCVIGVQCLTEFTNVSRRKLGRDWDEIRKSLRVIRRYAREIVPVEIETYLDAVGIAERYRYKIYDAQIIAAALRADCDLLLSEDMQHGQVIDGRLRIANPFLAPA